MATKQNEGGDKSRKDKKQNGAGRNGASLRSVEDSAAKKAKTKLQFDSMLTRDEAAAYFEAIAKGLRKGSIHFHQSDESLDLAPAEHIGIEVKAQQKSGRQQISFELEWRTDRSNRLTIVAGEAAAPAEPEAAPAST